MSDEEAIADLGELDETARILRAAELGRRARALLAEDDLASARTHAAEAIGLDPSNAEHLALHGYVVAIGGVGGDALRKGIADLDAALEREPNLVDALFFRGVLHRRLRDEVKAQADFARAAELQPGNVDVQRALRAAPPAKSKEPVKAPARPRGPRSVPRVVVALGAVIVVLGMTFSGVALARVLRRPPAAERIVRAHLVQNEADHALGPAHVGSYEHEDALDAMGPAGAAQIISLLGDETRAEDEEIRSSKSYRRLANDYLVHYADAVAKRAPPAEALAGEGIDWLAVKSAWTDWLAKP